MDYQTASALLERFGFPAAVTAALLFGLYKFADKYLATQTQTLQDVSKTLSDIVRQQAEHSAFSQRLADTMERVVARLDEIEERLPEEARNGTRSNRRNETE